MGMVEMKQAVAVHMAKIQEKLDAIAALELEVQALQCEADADIGALVTAHKAGPWNFEGNIVKFRKSKLAGVNGHPLWLITPQNEAQ